MDWTLKKQQPDLPTGPLGWWRSIVRSTWRAYIVFGGLAAAGTAFTAHDGGYAGMSWSEIARDAGVAFALMFLAAFITSLVYHVTVRRARRWPGGGGKRDRY